MNIFLTGATGFIGVHLTRRLISEGHRLVCLARSRDRAKILGRLGAGIVYGDVTDRDALREGMTGCEWVFHLANLYSMWEPDKSRYWRVNVDGTRCILEAALEARIEKLVYVSTVAVYGLPETRPFNEQAQPGKLLFSEYARSKAAANEEAWEFSRCHDLPLVVLYPGIVLGAGDNKASGKYIYDLLHRRAPSTIFHNSVATYVHVNDVVEALIQAAARPETTGQRYLIGKHDLNGRDYAEAIRRVSGVPLPWFRFPDWLVIGAAYLLTALSAVTRRPPPWGLSVDAAWTLKHGFTIDGSKAERELGLRYTPLECALADEVDCHYAAAERGSRTNR